MNRLTALTAVLAALAVPSSASAATLHELPFQPRPDRSGAGCLARAGDGLALVGPSTRTESPAELFAVTGAGPELDERIPFPRLVECPAVAGSPAGAAVFAGVTVGADYETALQAVVRDAGGVSSAPVTLTRRGTDPVAAVGAAGHAVVAWTENVTKRRWRILAARRAPGEAFGAPETLVDWTLDPETFPSVAIAAAVDASGGTSLVWARELPSDRGDEHVEAASAAQGAPFAVQRLASDVSTDDGPVISGAADGWTVAVFHLGRTDGLRVVQRPPGGAFETVAVPARPDEPGSPWPDDLAVDVRDGGGAVVAWKAGDFGEAGGIEAITREASGAFGPVRRVAEPPRAAFFRSDGESDIVFNVFDPLAGSEIDNDRHDLAAALAANGRVLLVWTAPAGRRPLRADTAHAATGRLDGTFDAAHRIGAPLRDTSDVAALFLADGRAAAAWTDNTAAKRDGRLHVAVEGAPLATDAPAPKLTLRAARFQRLFREQPLHVVAGCDRPCDIRMSARGDQHTQPRTLTRLRAGDATVQVGPIEGIRRGEPRMVRVTVRASSPGGGRITERTIRVRVARRASLPLQRPIDVTARRRGDEIVVRWRTAAPARRQYFLVAGEAKGSEREPVFPGTFAFVRGRGHTRFTVRLRPAARFRVPRVVVLASSDDTGRERYVQVKVR